MENIMASKESMLFKFFEKWKQKRLNKFAKKMIKDNPQLEKDLQKMADTAKDILNRNTKAAEIKKVNNAGP